MVLNHSPNGHLDNLGTLLNLKITNNYSYCFNNSFTNAALYSVVFPAFFLYLIFLPPVFHLSISWIGLSNTTSTLLKERKPFPKHTVYIFLQHSFICPPLFILLLMLFSRQAGGEELEIKQTQCCLKKCRSERAECGGVLL